MKEGRHSLGGLFLYHCRKKCHAVLRTVEGLPHVGLSLLQVFQRNLGFGLGSRFGVVMGFQPVTNSNRFFAAHRLDAYATFADRLPLDFVRQKPATLLAFRMNSPCRLTGVPFGHLGN